MTSTSRFTGIPTDWSIQEQNNNARSATDREHNMTVKECLRLYPKAIAFSLIFSTAIIMEGYDTALLGSFWGFRPYVIMLRYLLASAKPQQVPKQVW